jgi:hypothetical protein
VHLKTRFLIASVIVLLAYACGGDIDPVPEADNFKDPLLGIEDKGHIRFDAPQVGQRNYYVEFKAVKNNNGEISFSYLTDTVVMGIINKSTKGWEVTLHLTRGSNLVVQNPFSTMADSIFTYQAEIDSDSVRFKKQGLRYLSFIPLETKALPLNIPITAIDKADCEPELYYSIETWYTHSNFCTVLGKQYQSVIGYCDYTDMATDGLGILHNYQIEYGFTRIAWISAWSSNEAQGYDLVPRD